MVFNVKIKNIDEWKAVVNAIGDIVEDAMFICNDDGVTFRGMDPAHITLLDATFPKSSFESFEAQTSFFGINVNELKRVLNTANLGDEIQLQIDNPSSLRVSITGSLNMEYNIRLVERTEVNVPIPKITCTSKISVNSATLGRIMSNLSQISDYVSIDCFTSNVEFYGKGDSGDAKINMENTNPDLYEIKTSQTTSSTYSLEYMAKIILENDVEPIKESNDSYISRFHYYGMTVWLTPKIGDNNICYFTKIYHSPIIITKNKSIKHIKLEDYGQIEFKERIRYRFGRWYFKRQIKKVKVERPRGYAEKIVKSEGTPLDEQKIFDKNYVKKYIKELIIIGDNASIDKYIKKIKANVVPLNAVSVSNYLNF